MTDGVGVDAALECVGTGESMATAFAIARPGSIVGAVGAPHDVEVPIDTVIFRNVGLRGGVAPARRYIPELLDDVLAGHINPGRVFDFETDLEHVAGRGDGRAAGDQVARARRGRLMAPNHIAQVNHDQLFPGHVSTLAVTDPELIEVFDNFAFDEVLRTRRLDVRTRLMVQLAAMIAVSGAARVPRHARRRAHRRGHAGRDQGDRLPGRAVRRHGQGLRLPPRHQRGPHRARRRVAPAGPVHHHARDPRSRRAWRSRSRSSAPSRRRRSTPPRRPTSSTSSASCRPTASATTSPGAGSTCRPASCSPSACSSPLGGCEPAGQGPRRRRTSTSATTAPGSSTSSRSSCRSSAIRARSTGCGRIDEVPRPDARPMEDPP